MMSTVSGQENIEIITSLRELECCPRCILRYLGFKDSVMYLNAEDYLNVHFKKEDSNIIPDSQTKRVKRNPCRACLGIFQDSTIDTYVDCIPLTNIKEYNYSDFVISVSFPKSILIRDHSIFVYLKEKFPHTYSELQGLENLRKVFRIISNEIISKKINKVFSNNSLLNLTFDINYEDDELEVQNIKNINNLNKRGKQHDTSRNVIVDILEKCEDKLFKEHFSVPPEMPNKNTVCQVQCMATPMWIGGRYLKFSREMGQTPWIINNKPVTEHCLQDIIFESVEKILGLDKKKFTFCASGREDFDVRMLGDGRPFYIQIDDPKNRSIPFEKFREIEIEILKTKLAAVIKLQEIPKCGILRIKDGERFKRKHYYALCHVATCNAGDVVKQINTNHNRGLEIHQKTPIRVLHRRTQAIRDRCIYNMMAKTVSDTSNLFEIEIVTQAGTYVKEFVNGDFQRTQPSLSSIFDVPIDVVALDVIKIELTWPEEDNETVGMLS